MFFPSAPDCFHSDLTLSEKKRKLYCCDFCYELSHSIAVDVLQDKFLETIMSIGLLIIKPEAEALGRIPLILKLLSSSGYEIVCILETQISPLQTMEMWKYQWSAAHIDRIAINTELMRMGSSYVLLLKNPRYAISQSHPLAAILTEQKGSADAKLRNESHFRTILKPLNMLLNYIHTSDEPMDVIRELGILFEIDKLYEVYSSMLHSYPADSSMLMNGHGNTMIEIERPRELLKMLWHKSRSGIAPVRYQEVERHIDRVYHGKCALDLRLLQSTGAIREWDWAWIVAASYFIKYDNGYPAIL